jgi:hypothetical protein
MATNETRAYLTDARERDVSTNDIGGRIEEAIYKETRSYEVGIDLMGRIRDAVLDALAPELRHEPPEGCEWVAMRPSLVDRLAAGDPGDLTYAARDTVARRPQPVVETERVPALDALRGNRHCTHPSGGFDAVLIEHSGGELVVSSASGMTQRIDPDGTVEVVK